MKASASGTASATNPGLIHPTAERANSVSLGNLDRYAQRMALTHTQALVAVTVRGNDLGRASERLRQALLPYSDARIIALTQKTNWMTSLLGTTAILAAIEYTPTTPAA
jgi:hypothetical protein